MALTEEKIRKTYNALKEKAQNYLERGRIHKSLLYTHLAAYTNYSFFLSCYDEDLENIVKRIGELVRNTDSDIRPVKNRCVMLDSLARYRGGLTVQYIKAITSAGWELLYVTQQEMDAPHRTELRNFLAGLDNVTVYEVPTNKKGLERIQCVYNTIMEYRPERLYTHLNAYDAYLSAVAYAVPHTVLKFTIDITDHAFLLGFNAGDYSFEFRKLGCSLAEKYKKWSKDKMLMLPYYPIVDNVPFLGFPNGIERKVKILSGGIYWKIIDNDDTFFKLVKRILDENPDTVVLYPGSGDPEVVKDKIVEYGLENKLILLGWRNDLSELFRHSDIYLNTYPHGGGTMTQYAAHLHKPLLNYCPEEGCDNPVECFVCQVKEAKISSYGVEEFVAEANRLIRNVEYRKQKADEVYECVLGEERFNEYFAKMSADPTSILPVETEKNIKLDSNFTVKQLAYYNNLGEFQMRIVAFSGLNSITISRDFLFPFFRKIGPKLRSLVSRKGLHYNHI